MASHLSAINVRVPVRTAYNQWTQFEEFPHFMEGVEEVHQLDDKHLHWRAKIGGVMKDWDAEIVEEIPDERVAWRTTSGTPNAGVVTFHHLSADECRVMLQMEYEPEGMKEAVGDKIGMAARQIDGDLQRFKEFIESRSQETGAWRGEIHRPDTQRDVA